MHHVGQDQVVVGDGRRNESKVGLDEGSGTPDSVFRPSPMLGILESRRLASAFLDFSAKEVPYLLGMPALHEAFL